jgi:hypothetical protein
VVHPITLNFDQGCLHVEEIIEKPEMNITCRHDGIRYVDYQRKIHAIYTK